VDHPIRLDHAELAVRPWRTATLVVAGIAAVELVLLVMLGGALLAKPEPRTHRAPAKVEAEKASPAKPAALTRAPVVTAAAQLPRRKVTVVVLNGNGRQGAAAALASRVERRGYQIGLVGNAPSHDYASSLVMYRKGFVGEARRLARDLGVKVVGPLDGMRPGQLHGAHAVLILGG
jgi:LytR cell envelope-related transcriptional attenuator